MSPGLDCHDVTEFERVGRCLDRAVVGYSPSYRFLSPQEPLHRPLRMKPLNSGHRGIADQDRADQDGVYR